MRRQRMRLEPHFPSYSTFKFDSEFKPQPGSESVAAHVGAGSGSVASSRPRLGLQARSPECCFI
eukprot:11731504-Alexandrium_andersonii.AAC.1